MTTTTEPSDPSAAHVPDRATALALRLAHAENALRALTSGQVDAIIDPDGKAYLLRPAQESLRRNEQRLQAIVECAADVIMVVDRGGGIQSQSRAAKWVLGYEPGALVGKRIFELVHEEDLPLLYVAYFNVIEGFSERATVRFRHRDPLGLDRFIEATIGQLRGFSVASAVFTMRPIPLPALPCIETALPKAAPAVMQNRFPATLGQGLGAPPRAPELLGITERLREDRLPEAHPALRMIERNLEVLQSKLFEELTDDTTAGRHKVRLRLESVDIHEHIRSVLELCQGEIAAGQIEMLCYLRAKETKVPADSVRIQQVIWNLIMNAIKFSALGGRVSISTINDPPGHLTIEFADHGIGIEPALLQRVFDAFQQDDRQVRQRCGGHGLGLLIAQGLAEAQGGTPTAQSEGRGQGATVRLTLPLIPPDDVVSPAEQSAALFPSGTRQNL